jgi:hypothetical protein
MSAASAVFIGTTEGPVQVLSILRETGDPPSAVFLNGGTAKLRISAAYREFIERPSGFIERIVGHRAFRTDLSGRIDGGESWQLGMLVAHVAEADGRLVRQVEDARRVIWCSGSVRNVPGSASDIAIGAIDFLSQKLRLSEQMLRAAADRGAEVWVVLSDQDDSPEVRALVGTLCPGAKMATFGRAPLAAFKTFWSGLDSAAVVEKGAPAPRRAGLSARTGLIAGTALLVVAAGVLVGASKWEWLSAAAPSSAPAARANWRQGVTLQVQASVAPLGATCFSGAAAQPVDVSYALTEFRETALRGKLCGGRLIVVNRTSTAIVVSLAGSDPRGALARAVQPAQSDYIVLGPAHQAARVRVQSAQDPDADFSARLFSSAHGVARRVHQPQAR